MRSSTQATLSLPSAEAEFHARTSARAATLFSPTIMAWIGPKTSVRLLVDASAAKNRSERACVGKMKGAENKQRHKHGAIARARTRTKRGQDTRQKQRQEQRQDAKQRQWQWQIFDLMFSVAILANGVAARANTRKRRKQFLQLTVTVLCRSHQESVQNPLR